MAFNDGRVGGAYLSQLTNGLRQIGKGSDPLNYPIPFIGWSEGAAYPSRGSDQPIARLKTPAGGVMIPVTRRCISSEADFFHHYHIQPETS